MSPICIKHPHSSTSFGVCEQCLENIPSHTRGEVLDAIHEEYEIHCQLANLCRGIIRAVNG